MKKCLLIIDCNYIGYATKFGLSTELVYRGGRTEIIYGFLKTITSLANRLEVGNLVFCWDSKKSLRREICPEYKRKRQEKKTDEMIEADRIAFKQFDVLRRMVLPNLGFNNIFMQDGYESDDLIASLVMDRDLKECNKIVVSSDNDLLQLLDYCSLYNATKCTMMTKTLFMREYKITPDQWADVKTLAGCTSDNVSGVSGVGEKKAIQYLKRELKGKTFDAIQNRSEEDFQITRQLVKLPFPDTMKCVLEEDSLSIAKYRSICNKFGFVSMLTESAINSWKKLMENCL